jgi:hypothetical protein
MTRSSISGSTPNRLAAQHALQAVLAAGEGRLQAEEVHHLRQRQGDHGEVDALPADGDQPEHQPEQRRADDAGQDAQLRRPALRLDEPARDVAGEAEERGMAEGQQAGEPEQQVEGAGEQREAQQLHHEDRVQADHGASSARPAARDR